MNAPIAVVVITYNSAAVLPACLFAMPDGMAGTDWFLVVVDNASADDSLDVAGTLAPDSIRVQTGRNAGYAAGVNAGVAAALQAHPDTAAVLISNPDVQLGHGCAATMAAALAAEDIGIVVPRLFGPGPEHRLRLSLRREPSITRAFGEALLGGRAGRWPWLGETVADPRAYERRQRADWATGAVMLLSRRCLDVVGPWDESFFLYSEETDYALRARDAGLALTLEPAATATHLEGESKTSPGLWTILTLNRVRLFRRRHGRIATAAFRFAVLLREALRAARGNPASRAAARALLSPRVARRGAATMGQAPTPTD